MKTYWNEGEERMHLEVGVSCSILEHVFGESPGWVQPSSACWSRASVAGRTGDPSAMVLVVSSVKALAGKRHFWGWNARVCCWTRMK